MTIKKLTVAAAIAVGIASCSINNAMAACPCSTCPSSMPVVTSAPCCSEALPVVTGAACPLSAPCACETPPPPCNDCAPAPCGCDCKCATPASAVCPSTNSCNLDMKQVYGYPGAIYGDNNYVGEQTNAIYSTETAWCLDQCDALGMATAGVNIAGLGQMTGAACGCDGGAMVNRPTSNCGCPSGMAASLPSACGCDGGSVVDRCCHDNCAVSIQTANSIDALKKSFIPFTPAKMTGAAAPLMNAFPDVPDNYWAACPIDRLAINNVVVGYPDRYFRPGIDVSRAEFATMLVKGFNLNCDTHTSCLFKDVSKHHWANPMITKAVESGLMCGHPNGYFKPKCPVTRAEALTALASGIKCSDIDSCKAQQILSQYCDGSTVPSWAEIPIAKALDSGLLKNTPAPNQINPCMNASRADIASMLQTVRVAQGFDTNPITASDNCDTCAQDKQAYVEREEIVKIPTLKLEFLDEINAKSSRVGQQFATTTTEEVTINGKCYPCGSRVNGKIVEVIRPNGCNKGALKLAFTSIEGCDGCKCDLPKQILTAQISCAKNQNIVARIVSAPFTWAGGLVGVTGRTIGGMISSAGNAVESVSGGVGIAMGELLQGGSNSCCTCSNGKFVDRFTSAGRSLQDAAKEAIIAPVDVARTALSGTMGLFQSTGDEVAYLVDPNGAKISAVNPKEQVTIAFGCSGK